AAGDETYFQNTWAAAGSGVDLSGYDNVAFRVDRLVNNLNPSSATNFSVQLVNDDGSLSGKVPVSRYVKLEGPVGMVTPSGATWYRPLLQTASIPLNSFSGLHLNAVQALRLTFDSTTSGQIFIASVRATR